MQGSCVKHNIELNQGIISLLKKHMDANGIDSEKLAYAMDALVLDVTRVVDSKITDAINIFKNEKNKKLNSIQKEILRKYFIGYPVKLDIDIEDKYILDITHEDKQIAYELIEKGFARKESVMLDSLTARYKKNILEENNNSTDDYIEYIHKMQVNKNQLLIIEVDADKGLTSNNIAEIISNKYDKLSNFHHAIIVFRDGENTISWSQIAEVALFMEQFKKENNFNVYERANKSRRVNELNTFIKGNKHVEYSNSITTAIDNYYNGISYGFQFEDLFVTDNGKVKILVMQKVELDESPKKCPACMKEIVRGNSYPSMLYKSFECQNPSCPARSKIGRGKRYDIFAAKRQMMLDRNSVQDEIDDNTYYTFRRDIIKESDISLEQLLLLYSWDGDSIEIINSNNDTYDYNGREVKKETISKFSNEEKINNINIVALLKTVAGKLVFESKNQTPKYAKINDSYVMKGSSTDFAPIINTISDVDKFGGAVTSPPYYNAREYSQWTNLLCYLIDMMANAKAVFLSLKDNGTYIYNIGDVVGQDNIYINSNMSKRRQMLGFYSVLIFELVGFKTIGNIIWDKGEVQSKRNSTPNHISGYVKPVNAYEHCLVFSKNKEKELLQTEVVRIETVKKINSKGENILGHTAPYPVDIAKLITRFIDNYEYILDPFLGSGTTLIAMYNAGYKAVGFEINDKYYELAKSRIENCLLPCHEEIDSLFSTTEPPIFSSSFSPVGAII